MGLYLKEELGKTNSQNLNHKDLKYTFYLTDMESEFLRVATNLLKENIQIKNAEIM